MARTIIFMGLFSIIIFMMLTLGSSWFSTAINATFFSYSFSQVIKFTALINAIFVGVYFASQMINGPWIMHVVRILHYYLGIVLYAFMVGIVFWILVGVLSLFTSTSFLFQPVVGLMLVFVVLAIMVWGMINFNALELNEITIESDKVSKDYSFVMIADTQYGSTSHHHLEKVFNLAYAQNSSGILFVGDLVDSNHYRINDFSVIEQSPVPIYFVTGNHEYYHKPEMLTDYLSNSNTIELLKDSSITHDELCIAGIDYLSMNNFSQVIKNMNCDTSKFSILLSHEPRHLDHAVENGFDLILSGHTHAGQLFPFNYLVKAIYPYAAGLFKKDEATIYTSSGAGLFGPLLRFGSRNEIVKFTISPKG